MRDAWTITYSPEWDAHIVYIHGKVVCDETGRPALYYPPKTSRDEYDRWRKQVAASISRMSGVTCNIGDEV